MQSMSRAEIYDNANLLIGAGSETTATALSAATYLLAMNPEVLARLVTEVRESFSSETKIDFVSVQKLDYMLAVLDETLRLHPPSPNANLRRVCDGGDVICGQFVPHGVSTTFQCNYERVINDDIDRQASAFGTTPSFVTPRTSPLLNPSSRSDGLVTRDLRMIRKTSSNHSHMDRVIASAKSKSPWIGSSTSHILPPVF